MHFRAWRAAASAWHADKQHFHTLSRTFGRGVLPAAAGMLPGSTFTHFHALPTMACCRRQQVC